MAEENANEPQLRSSVGLPSMVALGLGASVGVGIFSILAPAAKLAGPAMLLSLVLATLPGVVISLNYAFMSSVLPVSGASYEWPRRFIHPGVAFLVGWLRITGSVGGLLVLALVLVRYLSAWIDISVKPTMLTAFVVVFGMNYFGVKVAAGVQNALVVLLVAVLLVFVAGGFPHASAHRLVPFMPGGWRGVLAAVPLLVGLFFGIESATELGDEAKNGTRSIPWAIAISMIIAVSLYVLVAWVALGLLGANALAAADTPLLDAAALFMGTSARWIMITAALIASAKSLNVLVLVFSRYLYAMGRSGVLPHALARVHPRFNTPHVALGVGFSACAISLLLPMDLVSLFLVLNVPTLLKYASTSICAARLSVADPALFASSAMHVRPITMKVCGYTGAALALVTLLLGLAADWRPYAALGVWAVLGVAYYVVRHRHDSVSDVALSGPVRRGG